MLYQHATRDRDQRLAENLSRLAKRTPGPAITMSAVARLDAPAGLQRGRPSQLPCILLARLAVDQACQGAGLGWELLRDVRLRAVRLSDSIGAAAVLVHCRDDKAKEFYLRHRADAAEALDRLADGIR